MSRPKQILADLLWTYGKRAVERGGCTGRRGPCLRAQATSFRALAALATVALASILDGCAVGYAGARTEAGLHGQPREIPAETRFVLLSRDDEVASSIERALRGQARVFNVRRATRLNPESGTIGDTAGAFVVQVVQTHDWPAWSVVSSTASFVTFAAVPGVYVVDRRLTFVLTAPGGASEQFEYSYRDWMVSWAPLILFCPNTVGTVGAAISPVEPRRRALDAIAAQFLDDAAPFVSAHGAMAP